MYGREALHADCRRCLQPQDPTERAALREALGCDADAPTPVWRAACDCGGNPACAACGGTSIIEHHRCPGSMLRGQPSLVGFQRAWNMLESCNVPPVAGGSIDQAAAFLDACVVMSAQRVHWERLNEQRREVERQRAANMHAPRKSRT